MPVTIVSATIQTNPNLNNDSITTTGIPHWPFSVIRPKAGPAAWYEPELPSGEEEIDSGNTLQTGQIWRDIWIIWRKRGRDKVGN